MTTWLISANGLLLTAGNGLPSVGATPPPMPTASAEITIANRQISQVAPEAFDFRITNISGFDTVDGSGSGVFYNAQLHELYYFWDFGDAYNFSAPTRTYAVHRKAGEHSGPWGRHVYRSAGSYAPKCTIYEPSSGKFAIAYLNAGSTDSGTAGTASASVDVADPDTVFAGTDTIFMSPSGSFSNAPTGAILVGPGGDITTNVSDIDSVMGNGTAGINGQETTPKRLMLNRGESYTFSGYTMGGGAGDFPDFYIVAGGDAGAKPSVTCTGTFSHNDSSTSNGVGSKDFVIDGISFDGGGDPTVSLAKGPIFFGNGFSQPNQPNTVMFHNCDFTGFDTVALDNNNDTVPYRPNHFVVADCTITDWFNAGIYMAGLSTSFLGNSIKCDADALSDAGDGMGAAFRGNRSYYVIYGNDMFSKMHWSSEPVGTSQPCLRVNGEATENSYSHISGNVLEGGNTIITLTQSGGGSVGECNNIVEKNVFVAQPETSKWIDIEQAATTVRNNTFIRSAFNSGAGAPRIRAHYFGGDTDVQAAPVKVYSNTLANMFYSASVSALVNSDDTGSGEFTTLVDVNNIIHQPNVASPTDLTLASSVSDYLPIHTGYIDSAEPKHTSELTPHRAINFDAQTANFTEGDTLTGGTSEATATIGEVIDNGTTGVIYLGAVSGGPFQDGETITDGAGGSATADGADYDPGLYDDYAPLTGSSVIGAYSTGAVAYDDFYGNIRDTVLSGLTRSAYSTGAHEPSLES